jgi:hypothetical protein
MALNFSIVLTGKRGNSLGAGESVPQALHFWNLTAPTSNQYFDSVTSTPWNGWGVNAPALAYPTIGGTVRQVVDLEPYESIGINGSVWNGVGNEFSLSIWFNVDTIKANDSNFLWSFRTSTGAKFFQIRMPTYTSEYLDVHLWDSNGTIYNVGDNEKDFPILFDKWYQTVLTFDGTFLKLYIGDENTPPVLVEALDCTGFSGISTQSMDHHLSSLAFVPTSSDHGHDGFLSMAGMWDKSLSEAQINHLWGDGSGRQYEELTIS